jgi:hypothetical protein
MRLRRRAIICAGLLVLTLIGLSSQPRTRGQVRNRDGGAQPNCQIDFFRNPGTELTYRVYSDQNGYFYLDGPNPGPYAVNVTQGDRFYRIDKVYIDEKWNLNPPTLVVPW